ncbi:GGDEF domain-containing protein [Sphingobium sp. SCG-1]|uniref:GGDEF domain-containing protein n=1 Tax=Sphingobium sp. SCG-1 TaxID=2072936 RepID=UPI000CD6C488|nr:GGDEF domain-containing protein [Sphingobium sp. SCG-1]AUW60375.1 GGDEF domain-containing protein [Sphingobium sp. SCG-1]
MRNAATQSQANDSHSGLTERLARWATRFGGKADEAAEESVSARTPPGKTFNREVDRRRQLYQDIGAFLFAHDLDLTPLNFGVAHDYLTGNDHGIEKAVAAVLSERGKITNSWVESVVASAPNKDVTADTLHDMLSKVEDNLNQFTGLVDDSRNSAKDYGAALQEQVRDLSDEAKAEPVLGRLITLTRNMVEKTRQVESQMRESAKQTKALQQSLESARRAAEQDHLTGLPNRRAFEATLTAETLKAQNCREPLSVAFCDIDHFKLVNDSHGHETGDRVLKFVSGLLAKISGDKCHVARHGGEEFVMLFRGKTAAEACEMVDAARADLSQRSLVNRATGERMDRITFSAGVANVLAYDDPRAALKAADRALYLAKEHGRNRVYLAAEVEA